MVLHGGCGACFAALGDGEDALRLNATVPDDLLGTHRAPCGTVESDTADFAVAMTNKLTEDPGLRQAVTPFGNDPDPPCVIR
jgi:hypothetical protein